jgi:hypothetical protein
MEQSVVEDHAVQAMEASMVRCFHMPMVFALAGAFAIVLGCAEPAGVASDPVQESSSTPSLRTEHSPEGFGALVIHAEQGAFLSGGDGLLSGNRTESTVGSVHGQVTSEDGQRFRFTQKFRAVILRPGELHKFVFTNVLTPIGN